MRVVLPAEARKWSHRLQNWTYRKLEATCHGCWELTLGPLQMQEAY